MDQEFQTSFIPKRPVSSDATTGLSTQREKKGGVLMLISIIVLVAALLAAAGVFAYKAYLVSSIEQAKSSLDRARDIFEPETIASLQSLDKRLNAAEIILGGHVAVSPILELLKEITYPNVQYTNFTYATNQATGDILVEMTGRASGFDWVGVQAEQFDKNPNIKNPIFSNLVQDNFGRIAFDLSFSVNKSFVTYGSPLNDTLSNQAVINN